MKGWVFIYQMPNTNHFPRVGRLFVVVQTTSEDPILILMNDEESGACSIEDVRAHIRFQISRAEHYGSQDGLFRQTADIPRLCTTV
jgi:hypothetical protein